MWSLSFTETRSHLRRSIIKQSKSYWSLSVLWPILKEWCSNLPGFYVNAVISSVPNLLTRQKVSTYTYWIRISAFSRVSLQIWIISSIFLRAKCTCPYLTGGSVTNDGIVLRSCFDQTKPMIHPKFFIAVDSQFAITFLFLFRVQLSIA